MPRGNPGILTRKINADITAYILNANGYPAGTTELPDVKQLLDEIQIVR